MYPMHEIWPPSDSMEPTLPQGEKAIVDTEYYYRNGPSRWEIAYYSLELVGAVHDTTNAHLLSYGKRFPWPSSRPYIGRPHLRFVKRIVGLPGESICFAAESIICNGERLQVPGQLQRLYNVFPDHQDYEYGATEYQIPENSIFLLSDNLASGWDSRRFGSLQIGALLGRVLEDL